MEGSHVDENWEQQIGLIQQETLFIVLEITK